jgi:23S rRNA pseudoU1915 N3-methylase RlmH
MDRIILFEDEKSNILFSSNYDDEKELQELVKAEPGIIEISSIFDSPLLIIGREVLRIDVLGITLSGIPVIVECKRKDNADMRYIIAQIFEYGSILKNKSFDDLDTYSRTYFNSDKCKEVKYKNKSLLEALALLKEENPDFDNTSNENIQDTIISNLEEGNFCLLAIADEIDPTTKGTIDFLNSKLSGLYIEMVEIKKFKANNTIVFVPQHINPERTTISSNSRKRITSGIGKTTIADMKSRGTLKQSENITNIINEWEKRDNCSIVMGTSGLSMRYGDIAIFWLFVEDIRIASPLKTQLEKNKIPAKIYDKINSIVSQFGQKPYKTETIDIEVFSKISNEIITLLQSYVR